MDKSTFRFSRSGGQVKGECVESPCVLSQRGNIVTKWRRRCDIHCGRNGRLLQAGPCVSVRVTMYIQYSHQIRTLHKKRVRRN